MNFGTKLFYFAAQLRHQANELLISLRTTMSKFRCWAMFASFRFAMCTDPTVWTEAAHRATHREMFA
jgi:hypothetical protein